MGMEFEIHRQVLFQMSSNAFSPIAPPFNFLKVVNSESEFYAKLHTVTLFALCCDRLGSPDMFKAYQT